jgi:threonyl-tRNA synthetase
MERFVGGLIEHYAGAFPVWLAPEQVRVIPISDETAGAAHTVYEQLQSAGLRVHLDDRAQTLNYRIREAETLKIPYMAVVGKREAEAGQVAARTRGAGSKQDVMAVEAFVARVVGEAERRALLP